MLLKQFGALGGKWWNNFKCILPILNIMFHFFVCSLPVRQVFELSWGFIRNCYRRACCSFAWCCRGLGTALAASTQSAYVLIFICLGCSSCYHPTKRLLKSPAYCPICYLLSSAATETALATSALLSAELKNVAILPGGGAEVSPASLSALLVP